MTKRALITGITGQDGSYLSELLLGREYEVHGINRRVSIESDLHRLSRISSLLNRICLHTGDISNYGSLYSILCQTQFDEIYHLAAQSFVADSYRDGFSTMDINLGGTHNLLEAVRRTQKDARVYFAGTSEQFGNQDAPQDESTPMEPVSPYGFSKLAGYTLCDFYRRVYGLWIARGILFNHESPRRGEQFVTRKITRAVAAIKAGKQRTLRLGDISTKRDFGDARDYVKAMHKMLQEPDPDDYVIASGHSVVIEDFVQEAFDHAGLNWTEYVIIDDSLKRDGEIAELRGNFKKAFDKLHWQPRNDWTKLCHDMVDCDINAGRFS